MESIFTAIRSVITTVLNSSHLKHPEDIKKQIEEMITNDKEFIMKNYKQLFQVMNNPEGFGNEKWPIFPDEALKNHIDSFLKITDKIKKLNELSKQYDKQYNQRYLYIIFFCLASALFFGLKQSNLEDYALAVGFFSCLLGVIAYVCLLVNLEKIRSKISQQGER